MCSSIFFNIDVVGTRDSLQETVLITRPWGCWGLGAVRQDEVPPRPDVRPIVSNNPRPEIWPCLVSTVLKSPLCSFFTKSNFLTTVALFVKLTHTFNPIHVKRLSWSQVVMVFNFFFFFLTVYTFLVHVGSVRKVVRGVRSRPGKYRDSTSQESTLPLRTDKVSKNTLHSTSLFDFKIFLRFSVPIFTSVETNIGHSTVVP